MMDPREQYQADTVEGLLVDINASAAKSWASPRGRVELRGCEVIFYPQNKPRTAFHVCEGTTPRAALLRAMQECGWWRPMTPEAKTQAIADLCDRVRATEPDADGVRVVTVVLEGSYSRSDEHDVRMDAAKALDRDGWVVDVLCRGTPQTIAASHRLRPLTSSHRDAARRADGNPERDPCTAHERPKTEAEVKTEYVEAKAEHDRASAKLACITAQAKRLGVSL
jgi:hypothetical protein